MSAKVKNPDAGDGRATRWDEHKQARRAELVAAAVAAIDRHGPAVGIAEIAAEAGVSKPVLYRHFADKADLIGAVGLWGAQEVLGALMPVLISDGPIRRRTELAVDAYLALIEQHPQVFLLLVEHPAQGDPLADGKELIAQAIARTMGDTLRDLGVDAAGAEPWAHGLVGLGLSTGAWWLRRKTLTRAAAGRYLTAFVWHAFDGIATEYGVTIEPPTPEGSLTVVQR